MNKNSDHVVVALTPYCGNGKHCHYVRFCLTWTVDELQTIKAMQQCSLTQDENGDLWTTKFCCFWSYYLEYFAIDHTCIGHYTWTVSEWTKDNTVSFGLWDMTKRFRYCLGS